MTRRSTFIAALAAIGMMSSLAGAQDYSYTPGTYQGAPAPSYAPAATPTYNADQLRQLLGPIALYPDPLLTEVLAAATYPQDIAAAQQWLQYFPTPSDDDINAQPWDPSVKALVHYPSVLAMMANQQDWTAALGAAFANQPQDVMNMVQQLRAEAQAANTLVSTSQQQIVNDNGTIQIVPAQPDVIYVPQYDPNLVFVQQPYYGSSPLITFGPSFGIGAWLNLDWDWHLHHVDQGVRWGHDWHHPDFGHIQEWHHNPARPIIVPRNFHNDHPGPGWDHTPDRQPVFDPHAGVRPNQPGHAPERPVQGVPVRPEPPHVEPHPIQPARPVEQPHPISPPPVAHRGEFPPQQPRVEVHAPAPINERPVEGIPHPAPAPHPITPAPAPAPVRSAPPAAPPSAFHGEGGGAAQSGRGHGSMGR